MSSVREGMVPGAARAVLSLDGCAWGAGGACAVGAGKGAESALFAQIVARISAFSEAARKFAGAGGRRVGPVRKELQSEICNKRVTVVSHPVHLIRRRRSHLGRSRGM